MSYRITKKEYTHPRPKWLTKLLFCLPPDVYCPCSTFGSARDKLLLINKTFSESALLSKITYLHMFVSDDHVEVRTNKERVIIRFQIDLNY